VSFLPEEDREFLADSGIEYGELTEKLPNGQERRAVRFPSFSFSGNLRCMNGSGLAKVETCDLLVVIPDGYPTTKLDSFYTIPKLKRENGSDPSNANVNSELFGRTWQFWSRHLEDKDWRVGIDDLRTFMSYIRGELRSA
jgi:hypothetical protein